MSPAIGGVPSNRWKSLLLILALIVVVGTVANFVLLIFDSGGTGGTARR